MDIVKQIINRDNFLDATNGLIDATHAGLDTETTGLYWSDTAFAVSFAYIKNSKIYAYYLDMRTAQPALVTTVLQGINNSSKTWFLHNAKFDMGKLLKRDVRLSGTVWDTKVVGRVLQNNLLDYSLEALAAPVGYKKSNVVEEYISKNKLYTKRRIAGKKKIETLKHFDRVPMDIIADYAMDDAIAVLMLGLDQQSRATALYDIQGVLENELALTKAIFDMEVAGISINREYTLVAWQYEDGLLREAKESFRAKYGKSLDDISKKELVQIFISEGETIALTDKGNPSLDGDALDAMTCEAARIIQEVRKYEKRIGSFYSTFIQHAGDDNVIHPNIDNAGTETGRFSMSSPNLQQLSKDPKGEAGQDYSIRGCFRPRRGNVFLQWDYSQQEYRLMADYANESALIAKIKAGFDVHEATAQLVGVTRDEAKTVNFAILYGAGADKLARMLGISIADARRLIDRYFYALPKVDNFIDRVKTVGRQRGFIKNWLGRRCHIAKPEWAYALPNHLIQGGGADVMKTAIVRVHKFLQEQGLKSQMVLTVHDSLIIEAPVDETWIVPHITKILEEAYVSRNGVTLTVDFEYSFQSLSKKDMMKGNKWQDPCPPLVLRETEQLGN